MFLSPGLSPTNLLRTIPIAGAVAAGIPRAPILAARTLPLAFLGALLAPTVGTGLGATDGALVGLLVGDGVGSTEHRSHFWHKLTGIHEVLQLRCGSVTKKNTRYLAAARTG